MGGKRKEKAGRSRKKRWLVMFFPILLFAAGAGIFFYPRFTDMAYQRDVEIQIKEFEQTAIEEDACEQLYQELRRRNEELYRDHQQDLTDPFAYEQPDIDLSEYGLSGNTVGFISIPKIQVTLPILLGANEENMSLGAVHLTETSYPVGGINTNSVIAAHRGYSRTAMFRDIEELETGDEILIENFRETLDYEVTEIRVIRPSDVDQLLIREGKDMVTLITCHPYGYNYQRYVVFCERK